MVSNAGNSRNAGDETTVEVSKNADHTSSGSSESRGSKLEQSLEDKLPRIGDLLNNTQNHRRQHDMSDEIDFYQVKNTLLCSYLLDLANLIQVAVVRQCGGGDADDGEEEDGNRDVLVDKSVKETIGRLDHMRIVMDKLRSLDQKLAYGMEKQLSLAHQIESKVAAAGGDTSDMNAILSLMSEDNDEQQQQPRPNPSSMGMNASKKSDAEAKKKKEDHRKKKQVNEDDESEDDFSSSSSDSDDDEDIDEDLKMAKSLARMGKPTSDKQQTSNTKTKRKRKNKDGEDHRFESSEDDDESESSSDDNDDDNAGVYRVPKMSSVEYYEQSAKKEEQERRYQKKQQEKLRRSEVMQTLMEQYGHAPEVQEHAGASGTTTTTTTMMDASTSRMMKKLKEKEDFEETYMIRLNETRQEKKERNKVRSFQSHGSLSAISDLGNLAAGISSSSGTHQSGPSRSKHKRRGGGKRRRR